MIRERVAIDGVVRAMEPETELQACCMHPEDVGIIKESVSSSVELRADDANILLYRGAVRRYLQGKAKWDKKVSLASRVSG
jgi:hypothetical protein